MLSDYASITRNPSASYSFAAFSTVLGALCCLVGRYSGFAAFLYVPVFFLSKNLFNIIFW